MVKHAPRYDILVLLLLFINYLWLVVAVNVGVILAMLLFIRRMSRVVPLNNKIMKHSR